VGLLSLCFLSTSFGAEVADSSTDSPPLSFRDAPWPFPISPLKTKGDPLTACVTCISQDSDGVMWFGGIGGVLVFNGAELFQVALPQVNREIGPINKALKIVFDPKSSDVWIVLNTGVAIHKRWSGNAEVLPLGDEGEINDGILVGERLWMSTDYGMIEFDPATRHVERLPSPVPGASVSIGQLNASPDGKWIVGLGRNESSVFLLDTESESWRTISTGFLPSSIERARDGTVWIGGRNGMLARAQHDPVAGLRLESKHELAGIGTIHAIKESPNGEIWLSSRSTDVIHRFKPSENLLVRSPLISRWFGVDHDAPFETIHFDQTGLAWIADGGSRILTADPHAPQMPTVELSELPSLARNPPIGMVAGINSDIWLASSGNVLRIDVDTAKTEDFTPSVLLDGETISGIYRMGGDLVVTTHEGIFRMNLGDNLVPGNSVWQRMPLRIFRGHCDLLQGSSEGDIWIGHRQGLDLVDRSSAKLRGAISLRYPTQRLIKVGTDIWAQTSGGLIKIDTETGDQEVMVRGKSISVRAVERGSDGNLWVGCREGLFRFNEETKQFSASAAVKAQVFVIMQHDDQHLWLGTTDGLLRFDPTTGGIVPFPANGQLDASGIRPKWITELSGGRWVLGDDFRVVTLTPSELIFNSPSKPAPLRVSLVKSRDTRIYFERNGVPFSGQGGVLVGGHTIRLPQKNNGIVFDFMLGDYRSPRGNEFAYRLDPPDENAPWQDLMGGRRLTIDRLSRGSHKLEVKAVSANGVPAEESLSVNVLVMTPIWLSTWFHLMVVAIVGALALALHRMRTRWIIDHRNELAASEERYRTIFETSAVAIVLLDENFRTVELNPAAEQLLEARSPDSQEDEPALELLGLDFSRFGADDDRGIVKLIAAARLGGPANDIECQLLGLKGTPITAIASLGPGAANRGFRVQLQDVTNQRQMQEQINHSQKMDAIGTLAGGIAHDFNNLLSPIIVHNEIAVEELKSRADQGSRLASTSIETALVAARQAAALTRQILVFGRKGEGKVRPVDVAATLTDTITLLRGMIPSNINLRTAIGVSGKVTNVVPAGLQQAVMNLGVNAYQAMNGKPGSILIGLEELLVREGDSFDELSPGLHAAISVSDDGCGIDAITRERIFEPFYTTKEKGKGTGLGLATVHSFVKEAGGAIRLESAPGAGTSFIIYLPVEDAPEEEAEVKAESPTPLPDNTSMAEKKPHVVAVDDEELVLQANCQILERRGYKVTPFLRPKLAIAFLLQSGDTVDVVLTDQMMPEMVGTEFAGWIKEHFPRIPVLLLSGFSEEELGDELLSNAGIVAVHSKPLNFEGLHKSLQEALASQEQDAVAV